MLKREQLAAAVVAAIAADPDWLNKHIRPAYSNHLWELGSMTAEPSRWVFVRRERLSIFGPEGWIHQLKLRLPAGLELALPHATTALVYERDGAIERVEFWP